VFSSWPDLTNQPISHPDIEFFMDGNNFVWKDTRFAGHAVVTLDTVINSGEKSVKYGQKNSKITKSCMGP
jgi:hypothetical protein